MRGFVRIGRHYVATLDRVERRIVAGAVADTAELLGVRLDEPLTRQPGPSDPLGDVNWSAAASAVPSDPALARLLPPASRDDDALAAEFRRLTEGDLRAGKVENLRIVWTALRGSAGSLLVPRAAAPRWAAALSDVRLVLATRLAIETDEDAEAIHDLALRDSAAEPRRRGREAGTAEAGDAEPETTGPEDAEPGATEPEEAEPEATEAEEVREAMATLYAAMTWLQESLVGAMLDDVGEATT